MELRSELCAPEISPERIAELCAAISAIEEMLEGGEPAEEAITALNADTGRELAAMDFHSYWESADIEDFALEMARPGRPKVADVTREELIEVVRRIGGGDLRDQGWYVLVLETNVVHPRVGDLLFHPPAELEGATPEQIVDAALSYRPIAL